MTGDARRDSALSAARYRAAQAAREAGVDGEDGDAAGETDAAASAPAGSGADSGAGSNTGTPTPHERAMYVETAIQQAIRRGEFDNLPGAGKPLEGLGGHHDPDWWIRRKIQTEKLSGLGPPALMLRTEHAEFEERVDALAREGQVREYVEDFNRRVIDARRQLMGGPPVVTPTRDADAEVAAWRAPRGASRRRGAGGGGAGRGPGCRGAGAGPAALVAPALKRAARR
ncbi:DUF1992 domain-containing protein [Microbacterium sp. bgisy203]|uniref:DnaJ family domain-containing protein n=1 Tax=Microbacterium sp. bgisy203 TaxID=3413799 RepID=UPI003D734C88